MADELVQSAIKNWAPRFTAQGVDYNDFVRTTERVENWDQWCHEWCATGDRHLGLADQALNYQRTSTAGEAYISAALCYHFGKFLFQDHYDEYVAAGRKAIESYSRGLNLLDPSAERVEIPFEGSKMVGTLRKPLQASRPALVMLLPGLDSTKEEFFYWENVFLQRGLATLTLEGPGQGECGYALPIRPDYEAAISTAMDWLDGRRDIDPRRVGIAGVSLGGYYAVRGLAFEPRVKAAVANCGPWNLAECWETMPNLSKRAFAFHSGASNAAEAKEFAGRLTLDGAAQKIQKPLLIIQGRLDRIIPWEQAVKIKNAVGDHAELVMYEAGNHVCNNLPYEYRPLTADWIKEKLADGGN